MGFLRKNLKQIIFDALAAAAFITPGTIIACAISGASFGYAMLWALLLAMLITAVMQEMYLRLGVVTGKGLAENLKKMIPNKTLSGIVVAFIFFIAFGSAILYIAGNISAIELGFTVLFPKVESFYFFIGCGILLLLVISIGLHDKLEMLIVSILVLISVMFVLCAFVSKPNPLYLLKGIFVPMLNGEESSWRCIITLIATTVLPYQLFLSASSSRQRWTNTEDLTTARTNLLWTILLSGIVSASIVICASTALYRNNKVTAINVSGLSQITKALIGESTSVVFSAALCFSGFASVLLIAINLTHFFEGAFTRKPLIRKIYYLFVTYLAIIGGALLAYMGNKNAISSVLMVQTVNALLLPICAMLLLYLMNHRSLKQNRNGPFENALLIITLAITSVIAYQALLLIVTRYESILVRLINLF